MTHITSLQNPRLKYLVRLRDERRLRHESGTMLVEGRDEIRLALAAGHTPLSLLLCPDLGAHPGGLGLDAWTGELITFSEAAFAKISYREHPDGYLALFSIPWRRLDHLASHPLTFVLVLEAIEKPGNLGAILRSADAAGVEAVIVCEPRVDLWNPNVVRASRGTLFTLTLCEAKNEEALAFLRQRGIQLLAATPAGEYRYTQLDLTRPLAWVLGTEDKGLSEFWLTACDARVAIPMYGQVNSLNVSVATAILLFETVRQRQESGA